jgi:hypothetical protein
VPAALGAQAAAPLQAGARVRVAVHGPDPRWRVGTLGAVADTVLVLRTSRGSLTIPARDVVRLQASRGTGPSVLGGVVGVLLGGAAGGAGGCLANRDDYGVFCGGQRDTRVVLGAVLGGAAGAVVGAVALRRERWQAADWPPGRPREPPEVDTDRPGRRGASTLVGLCSPETVWKRHPGRLPSAGHAADPGLTAPTPPRGLAGANWVRGRYAPRARRTRGA